MKKMKEIKNWVFASGKRKAAVLTALGVTAVAGASSLAVFALWEDQGVFPSRIPAVSANTVQAAAAGGSSQLISGEEAFAAVLAHAGLTEADVTVTENHLDWDDGVQEYDIDFYTDSKEYDYTVNAQTGEVRSYSIEARKQAGTASDAGSVIGEDAALAAALKHAGLESGDVQVVKNKLDRDDGVQEYDVEFRTDSKKYEYSVNAQTGEIRSYEIDALRQTASASTVPSIAGTSAVSAPASSKSGSVIGEDAALAAALKHAGLGSGDVQVVKNKLDWDDGVQEYEIEFYSGSTEYDYSVNAQTGEIRHYDAETHGAPASSGSSSGSVIGEDAALAAALKHAGLGSGDVQVVKNKLDWDDGVQEYEIEFYSGSTEYDYSVNAQTGEIWHYDAETNGAPASSGSSSGSTGSVIGEDAALAAALKHAGLGSGDVSRTRTELDRDDGRTVYEVEFRSGGYEYEYTVNAADGSILEHQKEYDD